MHISATATTAAAAAGAALFSHSATIAHIDTDNSVAVRILVLQVLDCQGRYGGACGRQNLRNALQVYSCVQRVSLG
jgi:hypothetical protein